MTYNVFGGTLSLTQSINHPEDCKGCQWLNTGLNKNETLVDMCSTIH